MSRFLVTGATGFVGGCLARRLEDGFRTTLAEEMRELGMPAGALA